MEQEKKKQHLDIPMEPVESSQIAKVGHHAETNTMAIQFADKKDGSPGSVYHYSNVTPEDFSAFKAADSQGSHFGKHIKPHAAKYPYTKVS